MVDMEHCNSTTTIFLFSFSSSFSFNYLKNIILIIFYSPKIYQSMGRREQVPYTISTVAIVVFTLYAIIISLGYYYYGSATKIPGIISF